MPQEFNFLKLVDLSIDLLIKLEIVFNRKIKFLEESSLPNIDAFTSLIHTMKEEQQEELRFLKEVIKLNEIIKQSICPHPKKDLDVCAGVRYCMNCNATLPK